MDQLGTNLSSDGQVLSESQLKSRRERSGECVTCGQKCYNIRLFKKTPLTNPGLVLEGRCLKCHPQDPRTEVLQADCVLVLPAETNTPARRSASDSARGTAVIHRSLQTAPKSKSVSQTSRAQSARHVTSLCDATFSTDAVVTAQAALVATATPVNDTLRNFKSKKGLKYSESTNSSIVSETIDESALEDHEPVEIVERHHVNQFRRSSHFVTYMDTITPRPAQVFFEELDLKDLDLSELEFFDDEKDYEKNSIKDIDANSNENSIPNDIHKRRNSLNSSHPHCQEIAALKALNASHNSIIDIGNIMLCNSTSVVVQKEGLHLMSLLRDLSPSELDQLQESCTYEVIVSAMARCFQDALAQMNGCKILFMISAAEEKHQIAIGVAGGLEVLIDVMKHFENDSIILEGCLLALSSLSIPKENIEQFMGEDMIQTIVCAMSKNVENCGLQEHGCVILANLAIDDTARTIIKNCGGFDTVIVSMVVNPMDVEVQNQALLALRNFCMTDERNRELLAKAGAIDAVIAAMQCHTNDIEVQERGLWVLSLLGMNRDNNILIGQIGGIDVIIRSMLTHPNVAVVQEKALRALWILSVQAQNRYLMAEMETISVVVTAMEIYIDNSSIQEKGCGTLTNLAATDTAMKEKIAKEGVLELVVTSIRLYNDDEKLNERAVSLIKKLCILENVEPMIATNMKQVMAEVTQRFPSCEKKAQIILNFLDKNE